MRKVMRQLDWADKVAYSLIAVGSLIATIFAIAGEPRAMGAFPVLTMALVIWFVARAK